MEETVTEENIFMDNTSTNHVAPIKASIALLQAVEYNVNEMSKIINDCHEEIRTLKEKLVKAKEHPGSHSTTQECLESFKKSAITNLEELYIVEQKFYIQLVEAKSFQESFRCFLRGGIKCMEDM